jgi:hypothetical protein
MGPSQTAAPHKQQNGGKARRIERPKNPQVSCRKEPPPLLGSNMATVPPDLWHSTLNSHMSRASRAASASATGARLRCFPRLTTPPEWGNYVAKNRVSRHNCQRKLVAALAPYPQKKEGGQRNALVPLVPFDRHASDDISLAQARFSASAIVPTRSSRSTQRKCAGIGIMSPKMRFAT